MMQRVLSIMPGSSLDMLCILPHSFAALLHHLQIFLQHLRRPPPPPPTSSQVMRTPSPPHPAYSTPTLCFYCYYCYYHSLHQHSPLRLLLGEALSCLPLCCLKTIGPPPAPFEHKGPCHLWNGECKYLQWDSNFTSLAFLKISCIPPPPPFFSWRPHKIAAIRCLK